MRIFNLGPEHPSVALRLDNLSWVLHEQGDYVNAKDLGERALTIAEHALPLHHPDCARRQVNLAATLAALGELDRARALAASGLDIFRQHYAEDHPSPQWAAKWLADIEYLIAARDGAACPSAPNPRPLAASGRGTYKRYLS